MKKISFLPLLALLFAVAASAFTVVHQQNSDLVWFEVDPSTGEALNQNSGGLQGSEPPISCPDGSFYCARALSLEQGEVVDNMDGTFGIATGVDITQHYNAQRQKNQ